MAIEARQLKGRRQEVLRQLINSSKFVRGSLVKLSRECGKPNCRCRKGKKHVSLYLSQSCKGKTKMTYISWEDEADIKRCISRYKRFVSAVDVLSGINLMIIKRRGEF